MGALLFRVDFGELEQTFPPRFCPRLRLFATGEPQQTRAAVAKVDIVAGREFSRFLKKAVLGCGVENQLPFEVFFARRQKRDRFVVRVDQQNKSIVAERLSPRINDIAGVTADKHSKATHEWRRPFLVAHLIAARIEPHHVLNFRSANAFALKKFRPAKNGMLLTKFDEALRK